MEEPYSTQEPSTPPERNSRPRWSLWLALGGIGILTCSGAFIGWLMIAGPRYLNQFLPDTIQAAREVPRVATRNNTMGDPNAPIHMIEYGDFQCPYCLNFWSETEPLLIEEYINTGKVFFEYRSVGEFLGPESFWAAEGAYCAGDQGKFWEYHDTLFTNWTGENVGDFTHDKLVQYAETIELDIVIFSACLEEGRHKRTVEQDAIQAEADEIHATPTFLINGRKVEGAQPYRILRHILEEILNGGINTIPG